MAHTERSYTRYTAGPKHKPRGGRRSRQKTTGKKRTFRWLKVAAFLVLLILVALCAAAAGVVFAVSRNLPTLGHPQSSATAQTTEIYDAHGKLLATLHGAENRVVVPSSAIPQVMEEATVASEDQRFYSDHGIDFRGLARALLADITAGHVVQGGSTITEEYIKNAYVGSERDITRKIREAILAWELEDRWSKQRILTAYLNTVYYGQGAYGVEMAAETYFHEHAARLSLAQAALLVAVAKLPTDYDPVYAASVARQVRDGVLDRMATLGYISAAQARAAKAKPIKVFAHPLNTTRDPSAYFVDYVTQELVKRYGYAEVYEGGLRVYTSLNSAWQSDALKVVKSTVAPLNFGFKPSAALVAIDPANGYIRAMVGGFNFAKQQFNLASQAQRQPGSAMKPFVLAAAVERGMDPFTTYYSSQSPAIIPMGTGAAPWVVRGDGSGGPETVAQAMTISDNAVFARLSVDVGPQNTVRVAHAMGITSPLQAVPSITLGTSVVTPLEMADAYATLADAGVHHSAQAIVKVVAANGKVLWHPSTKGNRAIPAGVASTVTQVLEQVASRGTGATTAAAFPYPRAGKTGTTENSWDVWYVGYAPQLATSVWMGDMHANLPMNGAFGATYCAPMWAQFTAAALAREAHPDFVSVSWPFSAWLGSYATSSPSPSSSLSASASGKPTSRPSVTPTPTLTPTPTVTPTATATTHAYAHPHKEDLAKPAAARSCAMPRPNAARGQDRRLAGARCRPRDCRPGRARPRARRRLRRASGAGAGPRAGGR